MAFEASRARAWVYDTLTGDAALTAILTAGVWLDLVPADQTPPKDGQGNPAPFAIIGVHSAPDHVTGNQTRVWADVLVQIKLYALLSAAASLEQAADLIDGHLQKPAPGGTSRGGTILGSFRDAPGVLLGTVVEAGRTYALMQLFYRVRTQV